MTKYILNSGGSKHYTEKRKQFFAEILKDLGKRPKVLFCFFAEKRENWEEKFEVYQQGFIELIDPDIQPIMDLAFPDKFIEQVKNNDAIIIHGGDDHLVQYWLKQFDLAKILDNKVVAASSAGSNALAAHFWTCDWRKCMNGLGILPIKFIPHYKSITYGLDDPRGPIDWEKSYQDLAAYGDKSFPIYALEEGEFIVMEK